MTSSTPAYPLQLAAWRSLQRIRGEEIRYHVTTTQSIVITLAVLTQPKAMRAEGEGISLASRSWNWLIDPDDLVINNTRITPAEGHWIMRGTTMFKLTPDGRNLVWRWSDASQVWRRVFCEEC